MRPILPFSLEFLLLAPLVLALDDPAVSGFYLFCSPWVLLALVALNGPVLSVLFRQLDMSTRRNHALEHATIFVLWQGGHRPGGFAGPEGFRVFGGPRPEQIREAFLSVTNGLRESGQLPHVSRHCGTNRVTALAFGMLLLVLAALLALIFRPPFWGRALLLLGVLPAFVAMRHAAGNWVQARFFMATDFQDAELVSIRKVKVDPIAEKPPVYFVETVVS